METRLQERAARLSPGARRGVRLAGAALTLVGIAAFVFSFYSFFNIITPPAASDADPVRVVMGRVGWWFGAFAVGAVLVVVGITLLRLGLLKPLSEIVASEAEVAVGMAADAAGRGWRQGAGPEVRVRCRSCRSLEREAARFCSACGAAL